MFVTRELIVDADFAAARARFKRIARTAHGGGLAGMSCHAYEEALVRLTALGPSGDVRGIPQLAQVRLLGPVKRDAARTIWLRWEATGAASGLFPTLNADLTLAAEDQERTRITLHGYYQAQLEDLDAGSDRSLLHHVASATIRTLLHKVAEALAG
jgi:hypothetical protein